MDTFLDLNDTPMLSIIVPVFNSVETIERCLDSICTQSYPNLEIICIDDGSIDETVNVIKKIQDADSRIKLLINNKNLGAAATRNKGINYAIGAYIGFIDSDDEIINPLMYESLLNQCLEHNLDFCKSRLQINTNGTIQKQGIVEHNIFDSEVKFKLLPFSPSIVGGLYNKKFLLDNQISYGKYKIQAHDVIFHFQSIFYATRIGYVNDIFYQYNYKLNNNSISTLRNPDHIIFIFKKVIFPLFKKLIKRDVALNSYLFEAMINHFSHNIKNGILSQKQYKVMGKLLNKVAYLPTTSLFQEQNLILFSQKFEFFLQMFYKKYI